MTDSFLDLETPSLYNRNFFEYLLDMPFDDLGICIEYMSGNPTYEIFIDLVRKSATKPSKILDAYKTLPEMQTKLFFVIDLWNNQENYPNFKIVWSIIFREICHGGKLGGLLFQAELEPNLLEEMHQQTIPEYMMNKDELIYFNNLPEEIDVWRLTGPDTREEWNGAYWFSDKESALTFAKNSYNNYSKLLQARVSKKHIMGVFFNCSELILKPWNTRYVTKINSSAI